MNPLTPTGPPCHGRARRVTPKGSFPLRSAGKAAPPSGQADQAADIGGIKAGGAQFAQAGRSGRFGKLGPGLVANQAVVPVIRHNNNLITLITLITAMILLPHLLPGNMPVMMRVAGSKEGSPSRCASMKHCRKRIVISKSLL